MSAVQRVGVHGVHDATLQPEAAPTAPAHAGARSLRPVRLGTVNGEPRDHAAYVADIQATLQSFPDYGWELRRALVDGDWLAVHLRDTGTRQQPFLGAPGDGSEVETDEYVLYHFEDGLISELAGTADNERLCR